VTEALVDSKQVLAGLKDFQRKTVEYTFKRLYGPNHTTRFLVADEVGLGKTLVARGLIGKAIDHLQREGVKRIDIIYVCSNADIARQNINRLNVTKRDEYNLPTRITLLPLHLRQLKARGINFVSFTPGTSFNLRSRGGIAQERVVLYRLLQHAWGKRGLGHKGVMALMEAGGRASFGHYLERIAGVGPGLDRLDPDLADAFKKELEREEAKPRDDGQAGLRDQFTALAERLRSNPNADPATQFALIGDLRSILARACVKALEADLIILDEFQRFRDLLDGDSEAAELAQHLFTGEGDTRAGPGVRVVLLSATPYKMYTLSDEADEDHYADFIRTAQFLMGQPGAKTFSEDLRAFRHGLLQPTELAHDELMRRKRRVENRLRRFMVRTERLGVTADRNGMLVDKPSPGARLDPADLRAYLAAARVSRHLDAGDPIEYWKSGSYLLNFMQSYKLKRQLRTACEDPAGRRALADLLHGADGLLPVGAIEQYAALDPGNARLRALVADSVDSEAWRLLWMPPSMPYYKLGPPFDSPKLAGFTKRLVFSSWNVVPEVIASIVSYEVERRMVIAGRRRWRNTAEERTKVRPILRFGLKDGRPTGMSLFGLLYPSPTLARLGDPLALSREVGGLNAPAAREEVLARAEERIRRALRPIVRESPKDGPVDEAWYWAAPILLDGQPDDDWNSRWLSRRHIAEAWSSGDARSDGQESTLFAAHIAYARDMLADPSSLGRVPDDLAAVLAKLAVGGPANCALRAFARVAQGSRDFTSDVARDGAARVAWGMRTLFNVPEVMSLIRGKRSKGDEPAYWIRVLDYCVNGNFQAVLSEYAHILREALGFLTREAENIVPEMAAAMNEALSVRAANYSTDDIRLENGEVTLEPRKLRARYALRFGTAVSDDEAHLHRADAVRTAFNSPFWPFVLATTSVGQEGLDFHQYCHAVVHWNLPANPVDLEQREGRVHRYKGHAIRKNVASVHRGAALRGGVSDPWEALFEAAKKARAPGVGDLEPYWIYDKGDARIERYVPALPLSREIERLSQLKRSLATYRMVFGQPRQEDLATFIAARASEGRAVDVAAMALDLSPRG
jgi:hypothetical protein